VNSDTRRKDAETLMNYWYDASETHPIEDHARSKGEIYEKN